MDTKKVWKLINDLQVAEEYKNLLEEVQATSSANALTLLLIFCRKRKLMKIKYWIGPSTEGHPIKYKQVHSVGLWILCFDFYLIDMIQIPIPRACNSVTK